MRPVAPAARVVPPILPQTPSSSPPPVAHPGSAPGETPYARDAVGDARHLLWLGALGLVPSFPVLLKESGSITLPARSSQLTSQPDPMQSSTDITSMTSICALLQSRSSHCEAPNHGLRQLACAKHLTCRRSLKPTVHFAVGTAGVPARPVPIPIGLLHQLLERLTVVIGE